MDWATVASVAITGAVGIAGVAGTIVAATIASKSATKDLKLSISAENERARNSEKRRIYAACLAAFTEVTSTAFDFRLYSSKTVEGVSRKAEAEAQYERARNEIRARVAEAHLIAP